ncbi:Serine/threonine-protein kinase [Lachnellula willkommii]|uniref:non-specific serine/threonine protein kinase n=1 Tax=Lachnellula willkommii TaxID=215461 RepID=A0A559LZ11_9HELO|nr:Serine/threonine-protein kinase [Lachnellula willkommii]
MTEETIPHYGDCASVDYNEFADDFTEEEVMELEIEEVSEPRERYDKGLYYPICIGEVLAGRYRIKHKLGWGGFSTVWMAHDMQHQKDVALKIMIPGEKGEYEYQMQNEIIQNVRDISHLVTHQGSFLLSGQRKLGQEGGYYHRVLVLPLLCPSLDYRGRELPVATRMSAAKQLLVALKGLHDIGLVHRDLNEGALMWEMPHYNTATEYEWLGRPRKMFLGDHLWKRGELVEQVTIPLDLVGSKLYLGDFGLVIKDGTSRGFMVQIRPLRATCGVMCLFATLYFGCGVFYGNGGKLTGTSWVNQLGAMPKQWKGKFWSPDWYDDWYDDHITSLDPMTTLHTGLYNFDLILVKPNESSLYRYYTKDSAICLNVV